MPKNAIDQEFDEMWNELTDVKSLEKDENTPEEEDETYCNVCKKKMKYNKYSYVCDGCSGMTPLRYDNDEIDSATYDNYIINDKVPVSVRLAGTKASVYQRNLFDVSTNKIPAQQKKIQRAMNIMNNTTNTPYPKIVIDTAKEWYMTIQQSKDRIRRGNILKGILAGLIYYACIYHKLTQKPKEIIQHLGIKSSYISDGIKIVQRFHNNGIIILPINRNPKESFMDRYINDINGEEQIITPEFRQLMTNIITEMKRMKISLTTTTSTNIAGTIWWLSNYFELGLTKEIICKKCGHTSNATFVKYSNLISEYIEFLHYIIDDYEYLRPIKPFSLIKKQTRRSRKSTTTNNNVDENEQNILKKPKKSKKEINKKKKNEEKNKEELDEEIEEKNEKEKSKKKHKKET